MQLILTEKDDKYTTINDHPLPKNIYKYNETHNDNGEGKYGQQEAEDTAGRCFNTKSMVKPKPKE